MAMMMLTSGDADTVEMVLNMLKDHNSILHTGCVPRLTVGLSNRIKALGFNELMHHVWSNQNVLYKYEEARRNAYLILQGEIQRGGNELNLPNVREPRYSKPGSLNTPKGR